MQDAELNDVAWLLEHAVMTSAPPAFAWAWMTDVAHWSDPPARFRLEGPFRAGARGTTEFPDREPVEWTIEAVALGASYTIASALAGAVLLFEWRFDPGADGGTRLTQRIGLRGDAARHADGVRDAFAPGLAPGMARIAALLTEARARRQGVDLG